MRRFVFVGMLSLSMTALACGGSSSQPAEHGSSASALEARRGRFATLDGMRQMTIDRISSPPRMQLDGSKDIVELTVREERDRQGRLTGYAYHAPNGSKKLFVSTSGGLSYIEGDDQLPLGREGDAPALGDPTVKGAFTPTQEVVVDERKERNDRLRKISVVERLKGFKEEEVGSIKRVADAFAVATADMFVRFVPGDEPRAQYGVVPTYAMRTTHFEGDEVKTGRLFPIIMFTRDDLTSWGLQTFIAYKSSPAARTPGLVWSVSSQAVNFVTSDGALYAVDAGSPGADLLAGVDASIRDWPPPLQHTAFGPGELETLSKLGLADAASVAPIHEHQERWRKCVSDALAGREKSLKELDVANIDGSARAARKEEVRKTWYKATEAKCDTLRASMDTAMKPLIASRVAERSALHEKFKARVSALGLAK